MIVIHCCCCSVLLSCSFCSALLPYLVAPLLFLSIASVYWDFAVICLSWGNLKYLFNLTVGLLSCHLYNSIISSFHCSICLCKCSFCVCHLFRAQKIMFFIRCLVHQFPVYSPSAVASDEYTVQSLVENSGRVLHILLRWKISQTIRVSTKYLSDKNN